MKNRRGSVETPGLDVLGMIQEAIRQTRKGDLTPDHWQAFVEHRGDAVCALAMFREWETFYSDVFGFQKDFSGLAVPPHQAGFDRLLVIAEGMTPNCLFEACQKLFPSWRYSEDLDTVKSERAADHDYAVWVRDRQEADEELRNFSAHDLGRQHIMSITLEERLVYGLKLFKETGEHLDVVNWTLCAGSRDPDGDVPRVCWDRAGGEVRVCWCSPDYRYEYLRTRAVVST